MIKFKRIWCYAPYAILGFLGFMAMHYARNCTTNQVTHSYLIVAEHDKSNTLVTLQKAIAPRIDTIIREVLSLPEEQEDVPRFKVQRHQHLTLYYPTTYVFDQQQSLIDAIDSLKIVPFDVTIDPDCVFFGDRADTLVMKIGDPSGALHATHNAIQSKLNALQVQYKRTHKNNLYDISASERFTYVPHIGLGRIPLNDTRYFSDADGARAIAVIKERIETEVFPLIRSLLTADNSKIHVDGISVGDLNEQQKIFEKKLGA